jgi:NitT/TauT family transport system substrate-binding protein
MLILWIADNVAARNEDAMRRKRTAGRPGAICAIAALAVTLPAAAGADTNALRISKGFGMHYLPLYIVEHERLIEKHAAALGLADLQVTWSTIDGGNVINDAMLAGALDVASIGVPGFLNLWDKAKGNPRMEVVGLSAVGSGSLYLNTRNPQVKTLADFTAADRIAVPGIKTSFAAVVLQMAAAKSFGMENYAKLDPLTVSLPHPDALAAMLSGKTEIDSHFCSPPFSYIELDHPDIHRVLNSVDLFGNLTIIMAYTTRRFHDANPKVAAAVVAAVEEANALIARDRPAAARFYRELAKVKAADAELMRILDDPDSRYSIVPAGVTTYADFMHRVGTLKTRPASWKDLFAPEIHDRGGS